MYKIHLSLQALPLFYPENHWIICKRNCWQCNIANLHAIYYFLAHACKVNNATLCSNAAKIGSFKLLWTLKCLVTVLWKKNETTSEAYFLFSSLTLQSLGNWFHLRNYKWGMRETHSEFPEWHQSIKMSSRSSLFPSARSY